MCLGRLGQADLKMSVLAFTGLQLFGGAFAQLPLH